MRKFLLFFFLVSFVSAQENDCLRVYNEGQTRFMEGKKLDEFFMEQVNLLIKNENQTCSELIDVINSNVDAQEKYSIAHGRFMTAELEYCVELMPGYANSAKLKQRSMRDRLEELQVIYGRLREEAVRANCIKED